MTMPEPTPVEPKKKRTGMIVTLVVILLLCCCVLVAGLGWYAWNNGDKWLGIGALLSPLFAL